MSTISQQFIEGITESGRELSSGLLDSKTPQCAN